MRYSIVGMAISGVFDDDEGNVDRVSTTQSTNAYCCVFPRGHTGYITCICVYDTYVITGSADNTVRKWDAISCNCLYTYTGETLLLSRVFALSLISYTGETLLLLSRVVTLSLISYTGEILLLLSRIFTLSLISYCCVDIIPVRLLSGFTRTAVSSPVLFPQPPLPNPCFSPHNPALPDLNTLRPAHLYHPVLLQAFPIQLLPSLLCFAFCRSRVPCDTNIVHGGVRAQFLHGRYRKGVAHRR